ncbi:unnamed protein product [Rotaria sordida]|uniref:C2 domain-containing protein n=1 Tax=Rotaria sordida TaxID=392033 RepID=A0A814HE35_9BILA|nr:unnamed protein product [Rotaria sordida]
MFKSSKDSKQKKRSKGEGGGAELMQQLGFQIPNFDEPNMDAIDDDDDDDLEAELKQIQQDVGGRTSKRSKADPKKPGNSASDLQSFHNDVNKLLSDIDRPINDDELSDGDEEDLLAELHDIAGEIENEKQNEHIETKPVQSISNSNTLSVLETRLDMYTKAVQTAKTNGDTAKARRVDRQLKLIQELLQSARTGAPINENDIPPALFVSTPSSSQPTIISKEVPVRAPSPPPATNSLSIDNKSIISQPPAPVVTTSNNTDEAVERLKSLALQAKAAGDMAKAKEYLIQMKNLQKGTTAVPVPAPLPPPSSAHIETSDNIPEDDNSSALIVPLKAPEPRTVMEALQQRHEELVKRQQEAISQGESSKARRMDRLVKQYKEAIDATQKGRPYDYSELADLPGFAPIPIQQSKPSQVSSSTIGTSATASVKVSQSTTSVRPSQVQQQRTTVPTTSIPQVESKASTNTRKDQQLQTLRLKQEQHVKLALKAKQQGDIDAAKKHLIASKEIEKMIESGLPIDMKLVSELSNEDVEIIHDDELAEELLESDRDTIYRRLQDDLLRQMQLCARNQQIYAQMEGSNNIQQANEFKILEQRCAHDLERLRKCFQNGSKPPLFHYEKKQMNIIQVNNDLTDQDLEVNVLRGINLRVPSGYSATSFETYVIIEFPYPPETPQTARTRYGIGSTIAEYSDSLHKFHIKRTDGKFKRLMSRKELKLSIFYRVGFLRSDRQLGIASIKLAPLEQTSTIHETIDIFENDHKKKAEGKLEVKIRIKEALGSIKSSEVSLQRWLVIDHFEENSNNPKLSASKSPSTAPSINAISRLIPTSDALGLLAINLANNLNNNKDNDDDHAVVDSSTTESNNNNRPNNQQSVGYQSIKVLKYEADLLEQQIEQLEDHLTKEQIDQLRIKHQTLVKQSDDIVASLRHGGKQVIQEHVRSLEQLMEHYNKESDEYRQRNEIKKADMFLHKKDLVAQEIETFTTNQLELNSSRNTLLCLSQYSVCLTAGCLSEKNKWRENLMNLYARISLCRTINRSLDYFACLSRIRKYGLGQNDSLSSHLNRLLTLVGNLCDFVYYPAECIAWLCEANVFGINRSSRPFRLVSLICWLSNIVISIIKNTIQLIKYKKLLKAERNKDGNSKEIRSPMVPLSEMYKCMLTLLNNFCFFLLCIHWLAIPKFLWSGKLPVFMVGLCGTLATICNIVKMAL